jgi:hypothetical protein
MKAFRMLNLPVVLLGFGGVLLLSPACKAQEVSPDHFTDVGIEDVYQASPRKVGAPQAKQTPATSEARNHRTDSPAIQLTATRNPPLAAQPGAMAIPEKRITAPRKPKKP